MTREELAAYATEKFAGRLTPLATGKYDPLFLVNDAGDLLAVARALKEDPKLQLEYLCNAGAIDTGKIDPPDKRFEIHYSVASLQLSLRLDLKVVLPAGKPEVESLQPVWPAADWFEREFWELFGIHVRNHNHLGQFLLPDDWNQGFPMRKDWDAPDFVRMPEK